MGIPVSNMELRELLRWLENQKILATKALNSGDAGRYREILDNLIALKRLTDAQVTGTQRPNFPHPEMLKRQEAVNDALKHFQTRARPSEDIAELKTFCENQKIQCTKSLKDGNMQDFRQRLGKLLAMLDNYDAHKDPAAAEHRGAIVETLRHIRGRAVQINPEFLADKDLYAKLQRAA